MGKRRTVFRMAAILLAAAPATASDTPARWSGAWGYAPAGPDEGNQPLPPGTYHYRATLTQAGSAVRLTFSNQEGDAPLSIAGASIGMAAGASGLEADPASVRPLRFSGARGAALPIGRAIVSDAQPFAARVGQDVIVSVSFSTSTRPGRTNLGLPMGFAPVQGAIEPLQARAYLSLISVQDAPARCTIVAFGDSITDGFLAASPRTRGWPGRLAERLATRPADKRCGVVNMGVSGNRMLRDGRGVAALDRFWRDVASVPGVSHVILLEGINDIGMGGGNGNPAVTPDMLIDSYRQFIARGHSLGIRVIGGTITPALSAGYMSPEKDRTRQAVNRFIRTSGEFDGVIDFDAAVRDPARPLELRKAFDPGDHLHPNDAGYKAMGDAIDLSLFAPGGR
jgi:lysophospholipase L1-like esterase